MKIILDLDNTITIDNALVEYPDKPVNVAVLQSICDGKKFGNDYAIYTARNMRTFDGDLKKINATTVPIIKAWLDKHNVGISEIHVGKPYPGQRGVYVDDRALGIDDYLESYMTKFLETKNVLVIPFSNPLKELDKIRYQLLFALKKSPNLDIVLIQNGANELLQEQLEFVSNSIPHCSLLTLDTNAGLGGAFKYSLSKIHLNEYDFVIFGHGNDKFDIKGFLHSFGDYEFKLNQKHYFITKFVNRAVSETLLSNCISMLTSIKLTSRVQISNPGIKVFPATALIDQPFDNAPDDYTIDLWLQCLMIRKSICRNSVIQIAKKSTHNSTWKRNTASYLTMIKRYIYTISKI